ncbi:tRNA-guanine(15) transglycosylase [Thermoplasmatales archaeon ex4572_165]|nr:MAG: tRNA-guanine(15) transglycosylase [Thermoplasmatales archaeon ex4572_165]RLF59906.1 MAG: tRNA guanosine(15) transglycosylase TgtA [Thermoplasmata archaeon]
MKFEIKDRDAAGRLGKLYTDHGPVTTPTLLPVINPNKILISPKEMKSCFDVEMVITNSYIIRKHKKLQKIALEEGVHHLIDFNGPIMTDSGTFQSYIYGSVSVEPLEIIEFQKNIGVDVGTILDVFGTPNQTRKEAKEGMKETIKRAKKSILIKEKMGLACTIQGSIFPDLRKKCAQELSSLDADLYPIGGVVPLMEQQRYAELVQIILASKQGLSAGKPVHLFGAGHPLIFPLAVALGCDVFDSSAYVKYAMQDRLIFSNATMHLKDIEELSCCCPVCSNITASELKKTDDKERMRLIARHNLYISMKEIKIIRNAIRNNTLWELVERKASENPWLIDALHVLKTKKEKQWLEKFEPIHKKKALIYTGPHTIHRPLLDRTKIRMKEWYQPFSDTIIVLPESEKPYHISYEPEIKKIQEHNPNVEIIIDSALGPVPIFLDEMYPFSQSVFPKNIDKQTKSITRKYFKEFIKGKEVIYWDNEKSLQKIKKSSEKTNEQNEDRKRIIAVASMQFGKDAGDILFSGALSFVKSKKTNKIRNVYNSNEHVVSLRASDGLFTLKLAGGQLIHKHSSFPRYRIIVDDDAVPFIKEGKSVFSKFVVGGDQILRPFDECIVVDNNDTFLGVGRCLLNVDEMKDFSFGQAVKMRENIS